MKKFLNSIKIKKFLTSVKKKKLLSLALVATLAGTFYFGRDEKVADIYNNQDLKNRSVKVVNFSKRSGGSGSIISSNFRESTILTNNHVCEVIVNGGLIISNGNEYVVTSYKRSQRHDLCLITVGADLGVNTEIATSAPSEQEEAAISGHPRLLPNVVTRGHFSGKEVITILTGMRKCTDEDLESPNMLLCLFLGGIPIVTSYEAQLVTALIQGGSSGSPVYNSVGQIAAVAFAGAGEMSQAYVVPYEAVATFFYEELPNLKQQFPQMTTEYRPRQARSAITQEMITKMCNDPRAANETFSGICSVSGIRGDLQWKN